MSGTSTILRAEVQRYLAAAQNAANTEVEAVLARSAFVLAQLAEHLDRNGSLAPSSFAHYSKMLDEGIDQKAHLLLRSVLHGERVRFTTRHAQSAAPTP